MKVEFKRINAPKELPVDVPATVAETPAPPLNDHLPKLTDRFLLAGKAIFTVSNSKGGHYTFKLRKIDSEYPQGSGKISTAFFLHVKATGGTYPFRYVGLANSTTGAVKCTAKSEFVPGSKEYDVGQWALQTVIGGKLIPDGYDIEHAGRCGKCGKMLTDPESLERGIGPECWKTAGA